MVDSPPTALLLRLHEALVLAETEQDIIACIALATDFGSTLRLVAFPSGMLDDARVVASWHDNALWPDDPLLSLTVKPQSDMYASLYQALQTRESVWSGDNLLPANVFRGTLVVKLYGRTQAGGVACNGAIWIGWSTRPAITDAELYMFNSLSQTVSAMANKVRSQHLTEVALNQASNSINHLQEVDRLKTEFLYMVSHDLRTPLIGILMMADELLRGASGTLSSTVQHDIKLIQTAGEHLMGIVSDMLDLAKLESGQFTLDCATIHIADLIQHVIGEQVTVARAKGLHLTATTLPQQLTIVADETRLYQVLVNLIGNAIKYSEQGTICIVLSHDAEELICSVADEGIGISLDHLGRVFEPFQQVENALTRKQGGTGLGLAICKRLVELHHGRIWIVSKVGCGTTVSFTLPLTPVNEV